MKRYCYVAYGDVGKIQLSASAKPLDALLYTGFDLYIETSPKHWVRAADLPKEHPIWVEMKAGAFKAGLVDGEGRAFTILNAYNPEHRQLAAREGLIINSPYTEEKRQALLNALNKIKRELRLITLSKRVEKIKAVLDIEKELEKIEDVLNQKEPPKQPTWDNVTNKTLNALNMISELISTNYERWQLQQAIEQAKKEAAFETAIEESILLNPQKLAELRQMLLA
ncbi:MAG: hypothetical protein QXR89_07890 [Candidatus Bathyarchaeia archaeon]